VVVLSCTLLGLANGKVPGRGGLQGNETLCVTGQLGDAVRSGRHRHPQPRLQAGRRLVEHHAPRAMMDLSDGLARDLPRLLNCGATIDLTALPLAPALTPNAQGWAAALSEGEDYELLVALPPRRVAAALADPQLQAIGFHAIGRTKQEGGVRYLGADGRPCKLDVRGWQYGWRP